MRLAAQMRGGFYPAAPEAIALAAAFLRPPKHGPFAILDPCAGEGAAIEQLGHLLGCPASMTYAIELDDGRAEILRASLPEVHVLAPANFFGCRANANSFSVIWLNPPFDHSYGGHRVESQFLQRATNWLMAGGVMALVCPEDVVGEYTEARRHFATYFEHCKVIPFPEQHRPFREVVAFGHKRSRVDVAGSSAVSWESVQAPQHFLYHLPSGNGPRVFEKIEPTEAELQRMLADSPLRTHLTAPAAARLPSPPLALGIGHVALLLASGHLDGVVEPEGKPPHVVRGTCRKCSYVVGVTETENDDGSMTTRTTIAEKIELLVRTVDLSGTIRTFQEEDANDPDSPPAMARDDKSTGGSPCNR
jgi:hypothetical protein